ncbi:MAG: hypothetical protein KDD06_23005, partial [Phaeodactylibacter sp.]|nr:hypothetical protein [Phaeodactylibacter sp.]
YETHIKNLGLKEQLELLELLMQSALESIRKEKNASRQEEEIPDTSAGLTDFQTKLLHGPLMSEEDYALFKEKKEHFAQWK